MTPREPPPGEGIICAWAIYSAMAEVGARCFADRDPEWQAELRRSVIKLDGYVVRNDPEWTPERIAKFKREQAGVGDQARQMCVADLTAMYQALAKTPPDALRSSIDKAVARPGGPSWGTCL